MYTILYAADYHQHDYRIVESEIKTITQKQFEKRCIEIMKEYHPVRFVILEHTEKGIVSLYRNKKIVLNTIWKTKNEVRRTKTKR